MVSIKRQRIKGYILLESLIATVLFAFIVNLILIEITNSRRRQSLYLQEEEMYQIAKMAVQTGQKRLDFNGVSAEAVRTAKSLKIYHEGDLIVEIEEN